MALDWHSFDGLVMAAPIGPLDPVRPIGSIGPIGLGLGLITYTIGLVIIKYNRLYKTYDRLNETYTWPWLGPRPRPGSGPRPWSNIYVRNHLCFNMIYHMQSHVLSCVILLVPYGFL